MSRLGRDPDLKDHSNIYLVEWSTGAVLVFNVHCLTEAMGLVCQLRQIPVGQLTGMEMTKGLALDEMVLRLDNLYP